MKAHKYTTNIPEARLRLGKIAAKLDDIGQSEQADAIRTIVENLMTRRPGPRRAPNVRVRVSTAIERSVRDLLRTTDLTQEEIARRHNIDGGRVSEIYRKMRN